MREDLSKILLAAHALRDLSVGFPESEIASTTGAGLQGLLSELLVYLHLRGGLPEEDRDLLTGALDRMPDFPETAPEVAAFHRMSALQDLKREGLTIGDCIKAFASAEKGGQHSAHIAAARAMTDDDFEMDDAAVVATTDYGAFVMGWRHISNDAAAAAAEDANGDWVIYKPENPGEDPAERFWSEEDRGWVRLAKATRYSERPPIQMLDAGPVCIGRMAPYTVRLSPKHAMDEGVEFRCFAESESHAKEQALEAHPNHEIEVACLTEVLWARDDEQAQIAAGMGL